MSRKPSQRATVGPGDAESPARERATPAKVARPRIERAVVRPRLFERLDALHTAPLTWVTGSPGAGKTTLLATWLAARGLDGLWYQLDPDDADVATFFHYLGLAVDAAAGDDGPVLPPLMPELMPGLMRYARDCAERIGARVALPAVVVLDDYERIAPEASLHDVVREFASALPEGLRMVVLSRTGPPTEFARMRLNERLVVVDGAELRLTRDEALTVAAARTGAAPVDADDGRIDRLMVETDGWFAGFNLLLGEHGGTGRPRGNGGVQPLLVDYFTTEAFRRFDATVQEALLRTALLPTMTVGDAQSMSGDASIGDVLAHLHRQNCFVIECGHDTLEYAFHALFRAFLLDRAAVTFAPDEWRALQVRAAGVLIRAGQTDAAAALFRDAGDWPGLAGLALREAPALVSSGRHRTLVRWLDALPPEAAGRPPWLRYWHAAARLPFDPVAARGLFAQAYDGFDAGDDPVGLYCAWAGVMESFFLEWRDFRDADRWILEFERLRTRHPSFPSSAVERRTYWAMGTLLHRQPQHRLLPDWATRGLALLDRSDRDLSLQLGGYLTIWFLWQGRTRAALAVLEQIAPWIEPTTSPLVHILWCCARGLYHSVQGEADACRAAVGEGLVLTAQNGLHAFDFLLHAQLARCSLVAGDLAQADVSIAAMARTMRTHSPIDGAFHVLLQSYAATQREDWPQAVERGRVALAMAFEAGVPFLEATCRVGLAQALIGHRDRIEYHEHLAAARAIGDAMRSRVVAYLVVETEAEVALADDGDARSRARGLDLLARALALSRDMDGATWLLSGPRTRAALYDRALAAGIETAHVQGLIRRRGLAPPASPRAPDAWPWPVRVHTFGRFEVVVDGQPLRSAGKAQRKPLELLKTLCAFGADAVSQDRIADALWPDTDGDAAGQALRTTLHRLRKLLRHDAAVRIDDRMLSLEPSLVWADCLAFDRAFDRAKPPDRGGLARVVERYRGPFLDGESAPWAVACRERLRARFLDAIERLGRSLEADADWAEAARCYARAVEVEPAAEGVYRRLMDALLNDGRATDALAVYRRCSQSLLTYLGVAPSHETQALYARVVRQQGAPPRRRSVPDP